MKRFTQLLGGALLALGFASPHAEAVIFRTGNPVVQVFDLVDLDAIQTAGYFDSQGVFQPVPSTVGLTGSITLGPRPGPPIPSRPEGDLNLVAPGGSVELSIEDIIDFDLELLISDRSGGSARVPATPDSAFLSVIGSSLYTDGSALEVRGSGPPGSPLIDLTIDRFDEAMSFPNGRRIGDDTSDLLIAQLFRGSINFLTAFAPEGVFEATTAAQLTPGDRLVIARAVPEPFATSLAALSIAVAAAGWRRPRAG